MMLTYAENPKML